MGTVPHRPAASGAPSATNRVCGRTCLSCSADPSHVPTPRWQSRFPPWHRLCSPFHTRRHRGHMPGSESPNTHLSRSTNPPHSPGCAGWALSGSTLTYLRERPAGPRRNPRREPAAPCEERSAAGIAQTGRGGGRSRPCSPRPGSGVTALRKHRERGESPRREKSRLSRNTILAQEQMSMKRSEISLGWKLRDGF